jgi:hypothetical protein
VRSKNAKRCHPSNLGYLLEEMEKDGLVIGRWNEMGVRRHHCYRLNPDVIRSPISGSVYHNSDGSIFEIPIELINEFMEHMRIKDDNKDEKTERDSARNNKKINKRRNEQRKKIIATWNSIGKFDFFVFIAFIEDLAKIIAEKSNNGQMKRFADMMFKYMLVFRERSRFLDPFFVEESLHREKQYTAILSEIIQSSVLS